MPPVKRKKPKTRFIDLTWAEAEWLQGQPTREGNTFERIDLDLPIHPVRIRRCIELLEKYPDMAERNHPGTLD